MAAILKLVVCLLVLGSTYARRCCFPDQFEGTRMKYRTAFDPDHFTQSVGFSTLHIDAINHRQAFKETVMYNGVPFESLVVKNHNITDIKYILINGECTEYELEPFPDNCVEDELEKLDDGYMGLLGGLGTTFSIYNTSAPGRDMFLITTQPYADGTCYPIAELLATSGGYWSQMILSPFNLTLGIKDESIFDIPEICLQGN